MVDFKMILLLLCISSGLAFSGKTFGDTVENEYNRHIPMQLLGLLHAPEVHQELGLSSSQIRLLEHQFEQIDGDWFRARNQPETKRREIVGSLEKRVRLWVREHFTASQVVRLNQLESQAQGTRVLLRDDIAKALELSEKKYAELLDSAVSTDEAIGAYQRAMLRGVQDEALASAVSENQRAENQSITAVLNTDQLASLSQLLGPKFDTESLTRIYPMAPDFASSSEWINSPALQMKQLRGKVVLVHFYAFQCHNCRANFDVYRRWYDRFGDKVVVVGIQTPETATEHKIEAVSNAARSDGFMFPVIFDRNSVNWKNWGNTMWPTVYVVDKNGYLRKWWQGELRWKGADADEQIEKRVSGLLEED